MMSLLAQVDIGQKFGSRFGQDLGFGDLVSIILSNALVIAGIIVLFLLIFAGISIMIGAGQNNPEAAARGKKAGTAALAGFVLIFTAYWIIQIVEKLTGLSILNPGL